MLKIRHLCKNFGPIKGLDEITFDIPLGTIVALLGPSGSGKSTLLRCLGRLEKPESGTIEFEKRSLELLPPSEIGMVFQSFHLFPHMSVLKNLMHAPVLTGKLDKAAAEKAARSLLHQFGLSTKAEAFPAELSGGQKQRIAIARALMMNPSILLFDEPTSALDPEMVGDISTLIRNLKAPNRVIIIATHELRAAHQAADHILFLESGHLAEYTTTAEFFEKPKSKRAQQFLKNFQI